MKVLTYDKGMGQAVANRTINREINSVTEEWVDVCHRVAVGNASLIALQREPAGNSLEVDYEQLYTQEYTNLFRHMSQGRILMSGRHLQHGDKNQMQRPGEVFTNCSTSPSSFFLFYLLLNGSGVGRSYDDDVMLVNWGRDLPVIVPTISDTHPDVLSGEIDVLDSEGVKKLYRSAKKQVWHRVADSREGWAKAVELVEYLTYTRENKHTVVVLDFSDVRPRNSAIQGMQGRPASGPGPLIKALQKISGLRQSGLVPWEATMFVDHFLAECVLVGGARRAARIATKHWTDNTVLDFIVVKRNTSFENKTGDEVLNMRSSGYYRSSLWSANNSVVCDKTFWDTCGVEGTHAKKVFDALTFAGYFDGTGEPGVINGDRLASGPQRKLKLSLDNQAYPLLEGTLEYYKHLELRFNKSNSKFITNPCGEIVLSALGAYCIIADIAPYFASSLDEVIDACKTTVRALIRTNLMRFAYDAEVKATNRIGVGITGFHEWAWAAYGYSWHDLINEQKSLNFWEDLSKMKRAIIAECERYSRELGVTTPHTNTTIKPAGTTSKLFALSEGVHLPAMREYLRWVQYRANSDKLERYKKLRYPVKYLQTYKDVAIVGFPTQPLICTLGLKEKLVTAPEATPAEQYVFLQLVEKYWITGVDEKGQSILPDTGNQISYTLKYDPQKVSFEEFQQTLRTYQRHLKCCTVLPIANAQAFEYLPEEQITIHEFSRIMDEIAEAAETEDVGIEHVSCAGGACPVTWKEV